MAVLTLSQIVKTYGATVIIDKVTFQLKPGEKAGLIGPNGSGKTTLLKIIVGELEADGGEVFLARGTKMGYLPQEPLVLEHDSGTFTPLNHSSSAAGSLRRHLEQPLRGLFALRREIRALEEEIAAGAANESQQFLDERLERYAVLTARFELEEGYQAESRLFAVARGLGFSDEDLDRDLAGFSGGEKTRARLAGLLLREPDLLLLDEPTNFLDLAALEWLEKYLSDLPCAMLIVSHDRYFLNRVAGSIFALSGGRVKTYRGNYSAYLEQLALETLSLDREYHRQQLLKEREERLVREAKADERSKRQARSRQKKLDKLEVVEDVEKTKRFKLGLGYSGRSGRQVIVFDGVEMKFGERTLFRDLNFEIRWGDRVALIGPNGAGKSTLLKLISGELVPTRGVLRLGPSVRISYFSQEQEHLAPELSLLETITAVSELDQKEARNHLGRYLFQGDDVFKRVSELSGGEKSRLALARLALGSGNCLIMDEPTSHLDLAALEELEKVLYAYPGTLVIVSHDRFFLKGLANRVIELNDGRVTFYQGDFATYLETREKSATQPEPQKEILKDGKRLRREEHRRRREEIRGRQRLEDRRESIEAQIGVCEEEIARLEKTLSDPEQYGCFDNLATLGSDLEKEKNKLETLMKQWEETSLRLEELLLPD